MQDPLLSIVPTGAISFPLINYRQTNTIESNFSRASWLGWVAIVGGPGNYIKKGALIHIEKYRG